MVIPTKNPRAIFVHGAGGGGWEWAIWARVFGARGWGAIAPDLQPAAEGLAATRWAHYLAQVEAWCGAGRVDLLVGASLGGLLALAAASAFRPRGLVLINPLPPRGIEVRLSRIEPYPAIVPWGRERSIEGTRRAMPDADDAACLHAFRRWRDESGAVLDAACAGIDVVAPECPLLVLSSEGDEDVAPSTGAALAARYDGRYELLRQASHVGPLLGTLAAGAATKTLAWAERLPNLVTRAS